MCLGRLYTLWSSEYPLAEVQPSEVWVTGLTKPMLFWTARKRMRKTDPCATGRERGRGDVAPMGKVGGDQSGSDLEGGDVSSEGDKMVDAPADLEIEEMGLLLASAVDGVRPNGVKTQKKAARTDGDLPHGADTEVLESVVPCG